MQERPDNEAPQDGLDRLFRKSAEEFEPQYDPAAWQTMSARLDERDRVIAWGYVLRWGLGVMALVLLLSVGWYGYKQSKANVVTGKQGVAQPISPTKSFSRSADVPVVHSISRHMQPKRSLPIDNQFPNPKNSEPKVVASPSQQELAGQRIDNQPMSNETSQRRRLNWSVVRQPLSPEPKNVAGNTNQPNADPLESRSQTGLGRKRAQDPEQTAPEQATTKKGRTKPALSGSVTTDRVAPDRVTPGGLTSEQLADNAGTTKRAGHEHRNPDGSLPDTESLSSSKTATNALGSDSILLSGHNEIYRIGPVDAMGNRGILQWPEWPMLVLPALSLPASNPADNNTSKPPRERGLSVRVAVSPDLSGIGINNFAKPGTNYGLLVEYRFNRRFSAQLGLIRSKKLYKALPEQYSLPVIPHTYVWPKSIDARCDMFDVPLNLRYDLLLRPSKNTNQPIRWFVSGGITTYIMQSEKYNYIYANPKDPRIKTWSSSGKTGRYNFSNVNLSIGYERPLTSRFALQVEPFMKMPLKGVGLFKVNLFSTGAFLSLKYRL